MRLNIYTNPSLEYLQRYAPPAGYVLGTVRVTALEIETYMTIEHEFVALLAARLHSTLGDMAAELTAPTLPVHDEPLPEIGR